MLGCHTERREHGYSNCWKLSVCDLTWFQMRNLFDCAEWGPHIYQFACSILSKISNFYSGKHQILEGVAPLFRFVLQAQSYTPSLLANKIKRFIELLGLLKTFSEYEKVLIRMFRERERSSMYFDKLSIMDYSLAYRHFCSRAVSSLPNLCELTSILAIGHSLGRWHSRPQLSW